MSEIVNSQEVMENVPAMEPVAAPATPEVTQDVPVVQVVNIPPASFGTELVSAIKVQGINTLAQLAVTGVVLIAVGFCKACWDVHKSNKKKRAEKKAEKEAETAGTHLEEETDTVETID